MANLKGPPGPQCNPPTGHLLLAGLSRCSLDCVYKWAGATRATQGGPLSGSPGVWAGSPGLSAAGPSALLRQSGGRSLSSGDSGRACTCKCALQAQPACPEWPLSCSREVVEREPGRGRQQENTGHQLRQGRFCFLRTIFTSGDGLEKWHRDL